MNILIRYRLVILRSTVTLSLALLFIGDLQGLAIITWMVLVLLFVVSFELSEVRAERTETVLRRYEELFGQCEVSDYILRILMQGDDFDRFILNVVRSEARKLLLQQSSHADDVVIEAVESIRISKASSPAVRADWFWELIDGLVHHHGFNLHFSLEELANLPDDHPMRLKNR